MSKNQLRKPVAFAVLLDVTLEWVDVAVKQFLDRIHADTSF